MTKDSDSGQTKSQASDIRHPEIQEVTKDSIHQVLSRSQKLDKSHLFLHIPKTGGSSFFDFISDNKNIFQKVPTPLFHTWTAKLALEYLPDAKIICFIRDPLERIISGYQSRSRMGLPKYQVPWRPEEATAFALFPTVGDFVNGLKSTEGRDAAATRFAMESILAIRWNYTHYFDSASYVDSISSSLMVYSLDKCEDAISDLVEKKILLCKDQVSLQEVKSLYPRSHSSKKKSSLFLEGLAISRGLK